MPHKAVFSMTALVCHQNGNRFLLGKLTKSFMDAAQPDIRIDVWEKDANPQGYQRAPSPSRTKDFGNYALKSNRLCPTNLVLNIRPEDMDKVQFEPIGDDLVRVTFGEYPVLYVNEGQHRFLGWSDVLEQLEQGYDLAVAFTTLDLLGEVEQFTTINTTQKGVPTELSFENKARLYREKAGNAADWRNQPKVIRSQAHEAAAAHRVMEVLQNDPMLNSKDIAQNVLYQRFREANAPRTNTTFIAKAQFGQYLYPVVRLRDNAFPRNEAQIARIVAAFWQALFRFNRPAFGNDHACYLLTKHAGVRIMTEVLITCTRILKNQGVEAPTYKDFARVLAPISDELTPEYWHHQTGEARFFHGARAINETIETLKDKIEEQFYADAA